MRGDVDKASKTIREGLRSVQSCVDERLQQFRNTSD